MEQDNDPVLKFKKNVSEILKTLAYFGEKLQGKSQKLLDENESNIQLDINNLEFVSLGIVNLMTKVKGNMVAIMNDLRSNIKDVDGQRPDKLFDEVISRLDLCQKGTVTLGPDNKYLFAEPCDKETMVDDFEQTEDHSGLDNDKNLKAKLEMNTSTSESYIKELLCSPKKYFNLGLKKQSERCDTEDTDDSWPDSLYRSSLVEDVAIKRPNEDSEDFKIESQSQPTMKNEADNEDNKVDPRKDVEMENDFLNEQAVAEDKAIEDLSKAQDSPASPGSDSPSSKIIDCEQGTQSNVDTTKNNLLNKATTSTNVDVENSNIYVQENNIHIVQNESLENDSLKGAAGDVCTDFLISRDSLDSVATTVIENNPSIEETTSKNVGVEDSDIVTKENDTNTKDESSEYDSEKTVIVDISTDKQTVSTNSSATIIGDYGEAVQQTGSVVDEDSDKNNENEDQEANHDDPIKSPWSVETEKLDSGDENTTEPLDSSSQNKTNELVEVSMDPGNSRSSVDSDETDIVNNFHLSPYDAPIDKVSCHSETFSDVSLSGDSNKSFEFDVMDYMDHIDDIDNYNGPMMTPTAADLENGDIKENESSSKVFKIDESCILPKDFHNSISEDGRDVMLASKKEFTPKSEISDEESEAEDNLAQDIKDEPQVDDNSFRDELLELLREVEVPCIENKRKRTRSKLTESIDSDTECKEAEEIVKMFECESSDDLSDSEATNSNSSFIDGLSSDESSSESVTKVNTLSPPNFKNKIDILSYLKLKENRMDDCFVSLGRLQLNKEDIRLKNILDTSIDRLCDLDNVLNKRKNNGESSSNENSPKCKRLMRRKKQSASTVPKTFDSDSDIEITDNRSSTPNLPKHLEIKFDDFLATSLMDDLEHSNQSISSDEDKDASKNNDKNKEKGKTKKTRSKKELSKEERKKKSWRDVPLLTDKLGSDSDSSSRSSSTSSSNSSKSSDNSARNRKIAKYERDSDFDISSGGDSSSSDTKKRNKSLSNKTVSSTDGSDDDNDVTFVSEKKGSPEDAGISASQKGGRRNIRALMSEESLAAETQRAHKEEEERINRLEDRLKLRETFTQSLDQSLTWSQDDSDAEDPFVLDFDDITGEPSIKVHPKLTKRMKPHQRDGIQFMWDSCYESVSRLKEHPGSGCILAHCMGLGKTYQVLALVHTLFSHDVTDTKRVLVVCPLSTVNNWKQETKIAFKGLSEDKFCISTIADKKEISQKYDIVKKWYSRRKGMLVLGYEGFSTITNESKLDKVNSNIKAHILQALVDPGPDLVICDEGHLLRNKSTLKTQALSRIRTKRRIMLTGTPLQNNLEEYYYMVQFVKPNLLGNIKEFRNNFINPIINGQYEDSTKFDIELMKKRTHVLFKLLKKTIQRVEDTVLKEYLPKMIDHALFIQLHSTQIELYEQYSKLCQERRREKKNRGFLADFRVFQYIGTHPQLLSVAEELKSKRIKERDVITGEEDNPVCDLEGWWKTIVPEDACNRIALGTKLVVLRAIVEECEEIGDKILVFSQSLPELELIEHFLKTVGTRKCSSWQKKKIDYCRMDGTIQPEVRTYICDKFNDRSNTKLRMLLMSTKVGGLGLNLPAANRIIIMTVNWNPSYDTQSVFRAYRFGQEKPVFVYRLVSLGTMEEKAYQRSVTKLAIAHRVIDKHQIQRHYQRTEMEELYSCRPTADEERPVPYVPEDKLLAKLVSDLPIIFKYHEHQALLANNPADDLSEQEKIAAWEEFEKEKIAQVQLPPPAAAPSVPAAAAPSVPAAANGPTFNMAFNIVRNVLQPELKSSSLDNQKLLEECQRPTRSPVPVSQSSNAPLPKNCIRVRLPRCTTISLEDNPSTSTATVSNKNIQATAKNDPLYIPPNNKQNISRVLTDTENEVNRKIYEILDKYNPKPDSNIQKQPSNNGKTVPPLMIINRTFNLPNLVAGSTPNSIVPSSSDVPPVNPILGDGSVEIWNENGLNGKKRKLKSVHNENSSKKRKNDGDEETTPIYLGKSVHKLANSPIILVDGDEEEMNSQIRRNYDDLKFSKVRMDLHKNNKKYVGDIITLD